MRGEKFSRAPRAQSLKSIKVTVVGGRSQGFEGVHTRNHETDDAVLCCEVL
jgi:hypothetical protein